MVAYLMSQCEQCPGPHSCKRDGLLTHIPLQRFETMLYY